MELRHLRYFVAAAEAGSLKLAAEKLHTTQPSLSRQIRDLEHEIGTPLFLRGARGVELTPAGRVFFDHARVMLAQAETALVSARRTANPPRPSFSLGFMIGHDSTWLPETLQLLRDELPNIHVTISTQNSPQLAAALSQGMLDIAFLRAEDGLPGLEFRRLVEEPLEVFLPQDHPLAARKSIRIQEIVGQTFLSVSGTALSVSGNPPALRLVIDRYLKESNVDIRPSHEVDNLGGVMSLIASTRGIALLPAYAKIFLPKSVTTRPLQGVTPKIDLSLGFRKTNASPVLQVLLSKADELVAKVAQCRFDSSKPYGPATHPGAAEILEVAILPVLSGRGAEFEASFLQAAPLIAASPGYLSHELRRCVEVKDRYILLVKWQTLEDHTVVFRGSAAYQEWRKLLHHFYDPFPTVEHYVST